MHNITKYGNGFSFKIQPICAKLTSYHNKSNTKLTEISKLRIVKSFRDSQAPRVHAFKRCYGHSCLLNKRDLIHFAGAIVTPKCNILQITQNMNA